MRFQLNPLAESGITLVPPIAPVITGTSSSSSTSGVTSIKSDTNAALTGAITLASGTGASLSQVGNVITISATGTGGGTVTGVSVVSANGLAGTVANPSTTPAITLTTTVTGLLKGNGTAISAATAGTDYQAPLTLTTTGTSGAATLVGNTLNVPQYAGTTYSAGTGLTLTTGTFSVNASQNITTLSNLTSAGFVKTNASGLLSVDTNTYLTANQSITLSGHVTGSGTTAITTSTASKLILQGTTDATAPNAQFLGALTTGLLKNTTTTGVLSIATAGTDYQVPITLTTTGTSGNATFSAGTLNIPNYTYTLPTASTSVLGGVKVDGTTITIASGVITATGSGGGTTITNNYNTTKTDVPSGTSPYGALSGLINGSNAVFTVSNGSYVPGTLEVFQGNVWREPGVDFTETSAAAGTFTFSTAPTSGDNIAARYVTTNSTSGNVGEAIVTKTSAYSINGSTDKYVRADATSAAFSVTLPTASTYTGYEYIIKKIDNTTNAVGIVGTLDGSTTYTLPTQYKYVRVRSNGTSWDVVGNN
jgi:hypothetical protein